MRLTHQPIYSSLFSDPYTVWNKFCIFIFENLPELPIWTNTNNNDYMKTSFTALLMLLVTSATSNVLTAQTGKQKSNPPNILYIMSDDHGYQAVSAYGYPGLNQT